MATTPVPAFPDAAFQRHGITRIEAKGQVLDPQLGFAAAGRDAREAAIIEDIYAQSIDVFLRAEALGGWRAVGEDHLFDIEYWDLEQAKLRKSGAA